MITSKEVFNILKLIAAIDDYRNGICTKEWEELKKWIFDELDKELNDGKLIVPNSSYYPNYPNTPCTPLTPYFTTTANTIGNSKAIADEVNKGVVIKDINSTIDAYLKK